MKGDGKGRDTVYIVLKLDLSKSTFNKLIVNIPKGNAKSMSLIAQCHCTDA